MPRYFVSVREGAPMGAVIEAADEAAARAEFCERLQDWADQTELDCEQEGEENGAGAKMASSPGGEGKAKL